MFIRTMIIYNLQTNVASSKFYTVDDTIISCIFCIPATAISVIVKRQVEV